jgi:peptidoglycan/LPS O-acetylase OafA/YrhL
MSLSDFFRTLPARLARVTTGGKIIREIDGLRFIAIFLVVVTHLCERFTRNTSIAFTHGPEYDIVTFIANRGFMGVHIFFVVSGFVLGLPFASHYLHGTKKVSLRSYFWRRLTRLEPPYIIVMTLLAASLVAMGYYSFKDMLPHYLASLVYLHNILYDSWSIINPPVWSLEIEVQFYTLAPFLALFFFRIKPKLLRRCVFVSFILVWMALQQYLGVMKEFSRLSLIGHLHLFLAGFILVDIYLTEWKEGITKREIFNYLSILAYASATYFWSWEHFFANRLVFALSIFLLVYSVFRSTWVNRFITLPWITAIGGMCYSIYLIHLPLIEFFIRVTRHIAVTSIFTVNLLIQFALLVPVLLFFSVIFFLAIEKPCMYKDWPMRLKNYLTGGKSVGSREAH